jgi:hypothetical protein
LGLRPNAVACPRTDQLRLSGCAGLTLYKVIHELQLLLATWTGACPTCHQTVKPLRRNSHHQT